ncbi:MAG: hypothetical protein HYS08_07885 [Chlamydiae bacterium]|nr:hypothetical protein [Chlamydiota bacterium]MBI3267282.1 hypothetical protein [Chlamydiota bacterium]
MKISGKSESRLKGEDLQKENILLRENPTMRFYRLKYKANLKYFYYPRLLDGRPSSKSGAH